MKIPKKKMSHDIYIISGCLLRTRIVWIIIIIMQMPLHFIGMCDSLHLYTRVPRLPRRLLQKMMMVLLPVSFRFISFFYLIQQPTKKNHMVHTQSKLQFSFRPVQNSRGNLPTASLTQMHIFAYITKLHHNPYTDSSKFWKISSGNAHSMHKMLLFSLLRQCHCQCNNIRFNIRSKACVQTWQ